MKKEAPAPQEEVVDFAVAYKQLPPDKQTFVLGVATGLLYSAQEPPDDDTT